MSVVFAGTPEFARAALQALLDAGFAVPLVLTQPDRPAGRGLKLQASPVKQLAQARGIAVTQPRSLRLDGKYPEDAAAAQAALQAARADVMVVAAYGLILPQWVLDAMSAARPPEGAKAPSGGSATGEAVERGGSDVSAARPPEGAKAPSGGSATGEAVERGGNDVSAARPPEGAKAPSGGSATGEAVERGGMGLGCLNIHASLLPRWRGAAPIHRAIEAGDAETGVTIMQMDAGLDTGDMLLAQALPIDARATTASLHDALAALGARLIVQALRQPERWVRTPQPAAGVTYAAKIDKHEAAIDWALPAEVIERRVRAFDPFPGAHTALDGKVIKVWQSQIDSCSRPADARCGQILSANDAGVAVACGGGVLRLTELQRAGGKRLPAREFLAGFALAPGQCFDAAGAAP
ncbi:methionyl-tRNA formyltransferase [Ottowia sp.]|uniref:methionyl-tRNA formyltransferase n=1 Tax=Ottowia sp. TaxID=1898956 RepID=UPI0025EC672B|nr:methionyl-tRNA formyltransferase [Ottowia sp.]